MIAVDIHPEPAIRSTIGGEGEAKWQAQEWNYSIARSQSILRQSNVRTDQFNPFDISLIGERLNVFGNRHAHGFGM